MHIQQFLSKWKHAKCKMATSYNLEESLRETVCMGNLEKVKVLVSAGVNVNSQNSVNGWTALHWAARRNHRHIVSYLLQNGADPTICTFKNELAVDVTQNDETKQLFLRKGNKVTAEDIGDIPSVSEAVQDSEPGQDAAKFVPNYLLNPEFPYSENVMEFAKRLGIQESATVIQGSGSTRSISNNNLQGSNNIQSGLLEESKASDKTVLVLKCRLADSEERDFIEIEMERNYLSFETLVDTCMAELNVDKGRLKKIRKLPNTIVRNDRDVKRLTEFQEIEIVID